MTVENDFHSRWVFHIMQWSGDIDIDQKQKMDTVVGMTAVYFKYEKKTEKWKVS